MCHKNPAPPADLFKRDQRRNKGAVSFIHSDPSAHCSVLSGSLSGHSRTVEITASGYTTQKSLPRLQHVRELRIHGNPDHPRAIPGTGRNLYRRIHGDRPARALDHRIRPDLPAGQPNFCFTLKTADKNG